MTVFTETMIDRQPQFADYVNSVDDSSTSSRQQTFHRHNYFQGNSNAKTAVELQQMANTKQNNGNVHQISQRRNNLKRRSPNSEAEISKRTRYDENDLELIEAVQNPPARLQQPKSNIFQSYGGHCLPRHVVHIPRRVQWYKNNTSHNTSSSNNLYRVTTTSEASAKLQKQLDDFGNLPLCPSSLELLSKLFPEQEEHVLESILKGCDDDVTSAIECIMPVRDRLEQFTNQIAQSQ